MIISANLPLRRAFSRLSDHPRFNIWSINILLEFRFRNGTRRKLFSLVKVSQYVGITPLFLTICLKRSRDRLYAFEFSLVSRAQLFLFLFLFHAKLEFLHGEDRRRSLHHDRRPEVAKRDIPFGVALHPHPKDLIIKVPPHEKPERHLRRLVNPDLSLPLSERVHKPRSLFFGNDKIFVRIFTIEYADKFKHLLGIRFECDVARRYAVHRLVGEAFVRNKRHVCRERVIENILRPHGPKGAIPLLRHGHTRKRELFGDLREVDLHPMRLEKLPCGNSFGKRSDVEIQIMPHDAHVKFDVASPHKIPRRESAREFERVFTIPEPLLAVFYRSGIRCVKFYCSGLFLSVLVLCDKREVCRSFALIRKRRKFEKIVHASRKKHVFAGTHQKKECPHCARERSKQKNDSRKKRKRTFPSVFSCDQFTFCFLRFDEWFHFGKRLFHCGRSRCFWW